MHPLLASISLRQALAAVPGLLEQTGVPPSGVHSLALDPGNGHRLGFHLGCGWSGVLDLASQAVTHVHAPAHAFAGSNPALAAGDADAAQMLLWGATAAAPALHRRTCWAAGGRHFCVPSRRDDALMLLDFDASSDAGCYALRDDDDSGRATAPPAVHVALTQPVVSVAAHPTGDMIVAGGLSSSMSLVTLPW